MAKGLFSWLGLGKKNKEKEQNTDSLKNQEQKQGLDLIQNNESLEDKKHIVADKASEAEEASSVEEEKNSEVEAAKDAAAEAASVEEEKASEVEAVKEAAAEAASVEEEKASEVEAVKEAAVEAASVEEEKASEVEAAKDAAAEAAVSVEEKKVAVEAEISNEAVIEETVENLSEDKKESLSDENAQENVTDLGKKKIDSYQDESTQKVKKSFFERLKKTRDNLAYGLSALIVGKKIDDELYEDLETALLTADLGVETTEFVIEKLKEESKARELHDAIALRANLKKILTDILKPCEVPLHVEKKGDMPFVILMVGVNGAGKTTTIGKLALKFKEQGLKVMLGAGDTFRAAAVEQLKEWGKRTDVPVISQPTGSDSASVLFDALSSARSKNIDVLICDTAGRLQNKDNLMEELKKIVRVMKKISDDVPHEVLLVLDSTTGQNAVSQMKLFSEAVNVTGLCLTKLDGSAKGGVIFALADKFKTPVRFVGIGEKTEDLRVFDVDNFVDALIGDNL